VQAKRLRGGSEFIDFMFEGTSTVYVRAETNCSAFDYVFELFRNAVKRSAEFRGSYGSEGFSAFWISLLVENAFTPKVSAEYVFEADGRPIVYLRWQEKTVEFVRYLGLGEFAPTGFRTPLTKIRRNKPDYLLNAWEREGRR
jgi:hypothetical protein